MNGNSYKWLFIGFAIISFFYILRGRYILGAISAIISIIYFVYVKKFKDK